MRPSPLTLLHGLLVAVGRLVSKAGGLSFVAQDKPSSDFGRTESPT